MAGEKDRCGPRGVGSRATGSGRGGHLSDISNAARLSPNLVCPDPSNAPRRWAGRDSLTPSMDEEAETPAARRGVPGGIPRADIRLDCGVTLAFASPLPSLRASKPLGPYRSGDTPEVPPPPGPQPKPPLPQQGKLRSQLNRGPAWGRTDAYLAPWTGPPPA